MLTVVNVVVLLAIPLQLFVDNTCGAHVLRCFSTAFTSCHSKTSTTEKAPKGVLARVHTRTRTCLHMLAHRHER